MKFDNLKEFYRKHPLGILLSLIITLFIIPILAGLAINIIYYDLIWREHRGKEVPPVINKKIPPQKQAFETSNDSQPNPKKYSGQTPPQDSPAPISKKIPAAPKPVIVDEKPNQLPIDPFLKSEQHQNKKVGIYIFVDQICGNDFNSFDQVSIKRKIKSSLSQTPKYPMNVHIWAGYKHVRSLEDTGTSIQVYSSYSINDDNFPIAACSKLRYFGKYDSIPDNITYAINDIAIEVASSINNHILSGGNQ